jgi:hypothetical protein
MGSFFTNYQVRSNSAMAVRDAMSPLAEKRAYVSPPTNGWVTVYDEESDSQDDAVIRKVAAALSKTLNTVVLAFLVHDSDIAMYWLYESGRLCDEFNSNPDYFGEPVNDATRARVAGKTDALLPLCKPGTAHAELEEALHPADGPPLMAEDMVDDLARLLGIDDTRASLGFNYFDSEGRELLPDADEFETVGDAERKSKPSSNEAAPETPVPSAPANVISLDLYPLGVGMMIHCWSAQHEQQLDAYAAAVGTGRAQMRKQLLANFDKQAKRWLKQAGTAGRPTFEELKTARDKGPDALAELLASRTPELLVEYACSAIQNDASEFVGALLKNGLDPNGPNHHGRTSLDIAAQYGTGTRTYQLLKTASDQKG